MEGISVLAYAKINMFLDIVRKRKDNYHNILSYMQTISLCDELTITRNTCNKINIFCDNPMIPIGKGNLAYKAAEKFFEYSGDFFGVDIDIKKKIPTEAGLGGGSSDAASVLLALNRISGKKLDEAQLCYIGAQIGSDVPFCIVGRAKVVSGMGEIVDNTHSVPRAVVLVACPNEKMSTVQAYKDLDERYNNFVNYKLNTEKFDILLKGTTDKDLNVIVQGMFNIFESIVCEKIPSINNIKKTMINKGALNAMMTGSGTAVFGIFENEEDAKSAKLEFENDNIFTEICYTII